MYYSLAVRSGIVMLYDTGKGNSQVVEPIQYSSNFALMNILKIVLLEVASKSHHVCKSS